MAKQKKKSDGTQAFRQHGVDFDRDIGNQAIGSCVFCGSQKFYVNKESALFDCKTCGKQGSHWKFLNEKIPFDQENFRGRAVRKLMNDRGLQAKTFRDWGVGWNGSQYTIPVNAIGKLMDLRHCFLGGKMTGTSGCKVSLVGPKPTDDPIIWIAEGEWDGMACWEALKGKQNVVALTGALSFPQHCAELFQGRDVRIVMDHDEAGCKGAQRLHRMLSSTANRVRFVHWPEDKKDGFDFRDCFKELGAASIDYVIGLLKDHPPGAEPDPNSSAVIQPTGSGLAYGEVEKRYQEWLHLPSVEPLHVLYGTILANRLPGDPLWLFLVAPPGGSKTELLMSLSEAPLIMTTTTLTPHALISGFPSAGGGDPSLIPKMNNKVLIVKDFTTILSMPQMKRDELFGYLRDAYDGECEQYFGNGVHRKYKSRFGVIAGVTPVIEQTNAQSSVLGERFLKYRLPTVPRLNQGQAIITRAIGNVGHEPLMRKGLQEISHEALDLAVNATPKVSAIMIQRIAKLATWVASLRGVVSREKYSGVVEYKPTAEVGTRLAKQLTKLGMGIAIFRHQDAIDESIYQLIAEVARSTAPDRVEELVKQLYLRGREDFNSTKQISAWVRLPSQTILHLLQDLELLRIVTKDADAHGGFWKLSATMLRLMRPLGLYRREGQWRTAKRAARNR